MSVANPDLAANDPKLLTAFELFNAYHTESSGRAKFITLVMVLEVLADPQLRPQVIQDFLGSVDQMIDENIDGLDDPDEVYAYTALKREIIYRREDSIRSSVRNLVETELSDEPDVSDLAKQAVNVYDQRSRLVHDGVLPQSELSQATTTAADIVKRILTVRFERATAQ